jgi:2-polyprenyl-3-methyl-5-hydroxy-6-metoxy-1,4-benzoquinol methylase
MFDCAFDHRFAEAKVIEANVDFYRQIGEKYDSYEPYLFDPALQQSLEDDLDKIGSYFTSLGRVPSCLECGGGTGNLTLKMCARGWAVTVVDVSAKMLDLLQEKLRVRNYSPTLIHGPIERFLETTCEPYDLVAFSSVLHHLYSYASVVKRVASRVRAGGLFYSNYDPIVPRHRFWTHLLASLDIAVAKSVLDPGDLLPGIGRRMRKIFMPRDAVFDRAVLSAGDVAEYHAWAGVDDGRILKMLQTSGFSVVEHRRFGIGRTNFVRFLNQRLKLWQNFKIVARRDSR